MGHAWLRAVLLAALPLACAGPAPEAPADSEPPCDPIGPASCVAPLRCVAADAFPLRGRCAPTGTRPEGVPCTQSASCGAGLQCILGRCLRPCQSDAECPQPGSHCAVGANSVAWGACTLVGACDYRRPEGCGAGAVCRSASMFGLGECFSPGPGGDGAPCNSPADCDAQHTCYLPLDHPLGTCRPVCAPLGTTCAFPRRCVPFIDRPTDVGACIP